MRRPGAPGAAGGLPERAGLLGQPARLVGVDGQRHAALGDAGDLGRVHEAQARAGLEHDPVEDVLALVVEHPVHGAHHHAVGGVHRGAPGQHLVADLVPLVVHGRGG